MQYYATPVHLKDGNLKDLTSIAIVINLSPRTTIEYLNYHYHNNYINMMKNKTRSDILCNVHGCWHYFLNEP